MSEEDLEIAVMGKVASSLAELDDAARIRVIEWASKRYNVKIAQSRGSSDGSTRSDYGDNSEVGNETVESDFEVFADLFDAANPKADADRALVAGYWFQVLQNQADFVGQAVNNALKDVGHGVGNITNALSSLQSRKPALVRQVAKSGRAQQARKKYKLTTAGVSAVRAMMNGTNSSGDAE